jgi:AcrR family transcriptional regulator
MQEPVQEVAVSTRSRILMAAEELFASEGLRAGGVDRIAERAGVTKRTLYYHFRSKDDLIAAYLAEHDLPATLQMRRWLKGAGETSAVLRMQHVLREMAKAAADPRWRGCGFLRAAFEVAEMPGHPARRMAAAHKRRVEAALAAYLEADGLPEPAQKARCLMLVFDGTIAQIVVHKDPGYADTAMSIVKLLLGAAQERGPGG